MAETLRLLLIEDSEDDAALVLRALKQSDFAPDAHRVDSPEELELALERKWDIILCDYSMPRLDAPSALAIVRRAAVDVPFIVVSGTIGEETAVEVMRLGAHDYLLKDNLRRLGPAIRRELREARVRAERLRDELGRKQAEASFRLIIERSPDLVIVHRDGKIIYANRTAVVALGYANGCELVGASLDQVVDASARGSTAEGATPQRWRRRDGTTLGVEVVGQSVVFEGEAAQVAMARDVTERNQLAASMIEMDRMAAVGILAAGVGHEINNPLAYVIANLEFVTTEIDTLVEALPDEARARLAAEITDLHQALVDTAHGAGRVRDIVQDLRTFSRSGSDALGSVDVRQVLDSAARMATVQIRHRAKVVKDYDEVPVVRASESRLGQVFLNLVVNAAQALPDSRAEHRIELRTRFTGKEVLVDIADTGSGIPPSVAGRVFEPFFTTKPPGQGTGLGLSICRRIVRELGGDLTFTTELDAGTTFTVHLPPSQRVEQLSRPPDARSGAVRRARILYVDDEPALGVAVKRLLAPEHDVTVVTSAREVRQRLLARERFDILLCDIMMPDVSGIELHAELQVLDPALARRTIFVTGGAFTPRAREFLESIDNPRVEKPLTPDHLRRAIDEVLVSAPSGR